MGDADHAYRIVRVVGVGGMGMVFEAVHVESDRRVALKVMVEMTDARDVERFLAEAKAASAASHENVVQILDVVERHQPPFFVMELLAGETLRSYLHPRGPSGELRPTPPVDLRVVVRLAEGMLSGLAAAHRAGIAHRDIKPSNVFIESPSGRVKILDFGIAKLPTGGPHTTTGTVLGTPGYLAKEQIQGERADARTDVHAVGLCLFEMIAQRRPFQGPNDLILAGLIGVVPPRLDALVKGVPSDLANVVAKALSKERGDRYADAGEMRAALQKLAPLENPVLETKGPDLATLTNPDMPPFADPAATRPDLARAKPSASPPAPRSRSMAGVFVLSVAGVLGVGAIVLLVGTKLWPTSSASVASVTPISSAPEAPTTSEPAATTSVDPSLPLTTLASASAAPSSSAHTSPHPAAASASAKVPSGPARPAKVVLANPIAWSDAHRAAALATKQPVDACIASEPNAFSAGMQISFGWNETKSLVGWWGKGNIPVPQAQRACLDGIATRLAADWTTEQRLWRMVYFNL